MRVLTPGTLTEDEALEPRAQQLPPRRATARPTRRPARARPRVGGPLDRALPRRRRRRAPTCESEVARIRPAEILLPEDEAGTETAGARCTTSPTRAGHLRPALDRRDRRRGARAQGALPGREPARLRARPQAAVPRAPRARCSSTCATTQLTSLGHVTRIERHDAAGTLVLGPHDAPAPRPRRARRRLPRRDAARDARPHEHGDGRPHAARVDPRAAHGPAAIERRLDGVEELVKDGFLRRDLRDGLRRGPRRRAHPRPRGDEPRERPRPAGARAQPRGPARRPRAARRRLLAHPREPARAARHASRSWPAGSRGRSSTTRRPRSRTAA